MLGKRFKRISDAIFKADQPTIDQWFRDLDTEVALAERQKLVKEKIFQAIDKGIEVTKITEITGIPSKTIYTWIKKRKQKDYIKEAKEMVAKAEEEQNAETKKIS